MAEGETQIVARRGVRCRCGSAPPPEPRPRAERRGRGRSLQYPRGPAPPRRASRGTSHATFDRRPEPPANPAPSPLPVRAMWATAPPSPNASLVSLSPRSGWVNAALRSPHDPEALDLSDNRQALPPIRIMQDDQATEVAFDRLV